MKVSTESVVYEKIGFTVEAVAKYPKEDWVSKNMSYYFVTKTEEKRKVMLSEIHDLCTAKCKKLGIKLLERVVVNKPKRRARGSK